MKASAPGKLLLVGDHAVVYGYHSIVTAVNQRLSVEVREIDVSLFSLEAPDLGLLSYVKEKERLGEQNIPKEVRFLEFAYKRFLEIYPQKNGVHVKTYSDFSCKFGFGSSSAVTVAFMFSLTLLYKIQLSKKELFDLCYRVILDVQGVGSGFDLAAAIWGGNILYVTPALVVQPIPELTCSLIVGYTGMKADTPTLIRMVEKKRESQPIEIERIFKESDSLVQEAEQSIMMGNMGKLGECMNKNQKLLSTLGVSSFELDKLIVAARTSGALGAKLSGAGGGDCMIALVEKGNESKVQAALVNAGGVILNVKLSAPGVLSESENA